MHTPFQRLTTPNHISSYLQLNQGTVTASFGDTLRTAFYSQDLRQHLERQYHWKENQCEWIAWAEVGKVLRGFSSHDQGRVRKFLYPAWLPTNNQQRRMKPHVDHRCPQRFTVYETESHVITCRAHHPTGDRRYWQQY